MGNQLVDVVIGAVGDGNIAGTLAEGGKRAKRKKKDQNQGSLFHWIMGDFLAAFCGKLKE